MMCN